jgi:hypothetical protein
MNNGSYGAIKPKEGDNACVLNRASGYKKTMSSMESKTRSAYHATDMNNKWTSVPGSGFGGNVKGYGGGGHGKY